jgi:hypothetical protein
MTASNELLRENSILKTATDAPLDQSNQTSMLEQINVSCNLVLSQKVPG